MDNYLLVLDDDRFMRELLREQLESVGHTVILASDEKQAFSIMEKEEPGCLLLDYKMPGASGAEILNRVKEIFPALPVIICTGFAELDLAVRMLKNGAFDFITKPVQKEKLLHAVSKALEQKKLFEKTRRLQEENVRYQESLHKRLKDQMVQIVSQSEFVNKLTASKTLSEMLIFVEGYIKNTLRCKKAFLMLLETDDFGPGEFRKYTNISNRNFKVSLTNLLQFKSLTADKLSCIYDRTSERIAFFNDVNLNIDVVGLKPTMFIPLSANQTPLGLITILEDPAEERSFSEMERLFLLFVAEASSTAIHNSLNQLKLEKSYFDTVKAITLAAEEVDMYTAGHSDRVRGYAVRIGKKMNFDDLRIKWLDFGGILHDIGKIGIDYRILHKEGRLTDEEYRVIREHPLRGERMIAHINFLAPVRKIVRHHHERPDGKGYPDGIGGKDLPIEAQILAIADSFDAMVSSRAYRRPLSREQAVLELRRCSGTQFNPDIVNIFVGIVKEDLVSLAAL
jgi:response regulator RpfG family c-di-GMP phosphodiesterase